MRITFTFCVVFLFSLSHYAVAQAPQGINYQGVARSTDGQPLSSKEISIRISILNGSANGDIEYDEIHEVKTNSFGLFTLVIGQGEPGKTLFNFVNWTAGKKWLQVEMDENGGRNFKLMGSQQLMSVPYALYAERAGNGYQAGNGIAINNNMITNLGDGDKDATNELISDVSFDGDHKLRITDAGGTKEADLSSLVGAAQDLSNVLSQGNTAGNSTITNLGTPVNASDAATKLYVDNLDASDEDKSATNEIQTLSKTGSNISLSTGGGSVVLNDDSPTNELQTISTQSVNANTRSLTLSNGNTIDVDVQDADANNTNEAQTLSKAGATVTLTNVNGVGGGSIVLNDDSNTNEAQTISRAGSTVTLTQANRAGGGSFSINDADADATNELQNLSEVLTRGSDAGGNQINNLADPTNAQDATTKSYVDDADNALSARISNTYAFKVTYNHTHNTFGATEVVTFTAEDFDDFYLISGNTFTAPENGTYQFTVSGISPIGGIAMQIRVTPLVGPPQFIDVKRQIGYPSASTINYYDSTILKLNANDVVELIVTGGTVNEIVTGTFFGFKL